MKTRIITAAVAGSLILTAIFLPWTIVLTTVTSIIAAIAVYEIFSVTGMLRHRGLESVAIVFAIAAPLFSHMSGAAVGITCAAYVLLVAALLMMYRDEVSVKRMVAVFALSLFVALSLSCLSYLRSVPSPRNGDGVFYVLLTLVMAWLNDSGAYFVGIFLGKHKLCPRISPKKTVEGLVGGIACSLIFSVFTAWCYQLVLGDAARVSYGGVLVLALICAPLAVVGDLAASVLKRVCKVKDFGNLFPGHGGMMDRFDSLLFVFPVSYFAARVCSLIV